MFGTVCVVIYFVLFPQLTQLPPVICQLKNLQVLNLCNNRLTSLPAEFGMLAKLHTLSLAVNQIEFLPHSFTSLRSLRKISLADNRFSRYPGCLNKLKTLKSINVERNPFLSKAPVYEPPARVEQFHMVRKSRLCRNCQSNYEMQQNKLNDVSWRPPEIPQRTKFL